MARIKPVSISKAGFTFCRTVVASLLWLSIILQSRLLVGVVFLIMLSSAILKVERAPLILLYKYTGDKIRPGAKTVVDQTGIFVSHVVGAVFALLCLVLLTLAPPLVAWIVTAAFAVLQTSAAFGFCSALKLYECMVGGTCCRVGRLARKAKDSVKPS